MAICRFLFLFIALGAVKYPHAQKSTPVEKNVIIVFDVPEKSNRDSIRVNYTPYDYVASTKWTPARVIWQGRQAKWIIPCSDPLFVDFIALLGPGNKMNFCEPGDSLHIMIRNGLPLFEGRNVEKFKMIREMLALEALMPKPSNPSFYRTNSMQDYMDWKKYLDDRLSLLHTVYNSYRKEVTSMAFEYLLAEKIIEIEYYRLMKFGDLRKTIKRSGISVEQLCAIFDSTTYNPSVAWLRSYTGRIRNYYYCYDFVRKSVERRFNFDSNNDTLKRAERKLLCAELGDKLYKGHMLQGFYVYLLTGRGLQEHSLKGDNLVVDSLLKKFYTQPDYPEYKTYVKRYEQRIRAEATLAKHITPELYLRNMQGEIVSVNQMRGKIVFLNFKHADSEGEDSQQEVINKLRQEFSNDTNFVHISVLVGSGKPKNIRNNGPEKLLYLNTKSSDDSIILVRYDVRALPQRYVLSPYGRILYKSNSAKSGDMEMANLVRKEMAFLHDGPYVLYKEDTTIVYSLNGNAVKVQTALSGYDLQLTTSPDIYGTGFSVKLKTVLENEPSQFDAVDKILALSDIEGNFDVLRKILQQNKIIDENYNWIFGSGHLVFVGDMFDRGKQVTECLWLVYTLEEKAKVAGGYVHFILGNHEMMNLQGNHKYAEKKYTNSSARLGKSLQQLYDESSELGRWLRTKNIVEKIGDLLFVHGGVSAELNRTGLTIKQINELARPNYAESKSDYGNSQINTVMSTKAGPFWFRGYYGNNKIDETIVDSTLQQFRVNHIITGHTIVSDVITAHYQNKVINTDTKHAEEESEALLIEGGRYCRVNDKGERVLLFIDAKRKSTSSE